jgi:hypothetical protein
VKRAEPTRARRLSSSEASACSTVYNDARYPIFSL